jgi:hypothetical protein
LHWAIRWGCLAHGSCKRRSKSCMVMADGMPLPSCA